MRRQPLSGLRKFSGLAAESPALSVVIRRGKKRAVPARRKRQTSTSPQGLSVQTNYVFLSSFVFPCSWPVYLLRPPPPPRDPPPPLDPMLELPRELLARAELPLLREAPPNASPLEPLPEPGEVLRLPTRSLPPPEEGRFALLSPAPPAELRSLAVRVCCPREEASRVPACPLFPA